MSEGPSLGYVKLRQCSLTALTSNHCSPGKIRCFVRRLVFSRNCSDLTVAVLCVRHSCCRYIVMIHTLHDLCCPQTRLWEHRDLLTYNTQRTPRSLSTLKCILELYLYTNVCDFFCVLYYFVLVLRRFIFQLHKCSIQQNGCL